MLTKCLDYVSEFFLYLLLLGITFSNFLTELSSGFIIFCFLLKIVFLRRAPRFSIPLDILIGIFLAWIFISAVRSPYPQESFGKVLRWLRYVFVYVALLNFFASDSKRLKRFFWVLIGVGAFTFFNGIFQSRFGFSILRSDRTVNPLDVLKRISASFVHPNDFGAFIIMVLPLTFGFFWPRLRKYKRIILAAVFLLGLYCLLKTFSRGAWLGFLVALVVFFLFYKKKVILLLLAVIATTILIFPGGLEHLAALFVQKHHTVWERTKLWQGTLNMIKEHPIIGFGINTFSKYFPQYKPKDYPDIRYAHNCYLQMWAEIGIIGLSIFIAIIIVVISITFYRLREKINSGFEGFILLALISGYTGFLVQSGLDTNLYSLVLTFHFWTLTAYIVSLNQYLKKKVYG